MPKIADKFRKILRDPSQGPLVSIDKLIKSYQVTDETFELDLKEIFSEIKEQDQQIIQEFRKFYADFQWSENESLNNYPKNSSERRDKINEIIELPADVIEVLDRLIPQIITEHTVIFSEKPSEPWIDKVDSTFHYWNSFKNHLLNKKLKNNNKKYEIVDDLDESSNIVLDFLEPPTREMPYQTKGLVVGHVQSGKTQHMEALVSKAIDAGYKVIILLTGRHTLLRQQTQKRFDQDILGKEIIHPDINDFNNLPDDDIARDYFDDPGFILPYSDPKGTFVSHGYIPSPGNGAMKIKRVTDFTDNGLDSSRVATSPFSFTGDNTFENLKNTEAHFVATNKTVASMKKIIKMLKKVGTDGLEKMPALIIDDESDSASTTPFTETNEAGERDLQPTNEVIRKLIKVLPRAQYVAYTATPYANVFTTSDDKDDLFPKDFITMLKAPEEYMGPKDFISEDLSKDFRDEDFSPYVRDAILTDESDSIQMALDAFLLSGAIKLYREQSHGLEIGDMYENHTMLVHSSHKNEDQHKVIRKFQDMWDLGDYTSGGLVRLEKLYSEDFLITSENLNRESSMSTLPDFDELKKFINKAKTLIANDENIYIKIDQHNPAPSFSKEPGEPGTWKIITGGNMLSRGFTIPDLTITYFTRAATAGDTLEQMARWFGYRIGYKDLVRLYIARDARDGRVDIYEDFVDICKTENNLRELLTNLPVSKDESFRREITPRDFGIYVVQEGRLKPTAAPKMRNIGSVSENFGGQPFDKSQSFPKQGSKEDVHNMELFHKLLDSTSLEKEEFTFSKDKSSRKFWIGDIKNIDFYEFLKKFTWTVEDPTKVLQWYLNGNLECPKSRKESDYYEECHECSPSIDKWKLIINDGDSRLDDQYSKYKYKDYEFVVVGRSESKLQGWKSLENRADVKYVNYINDEESKNYGRASKELKNSYELNTGIIHGYLVDNIENPTGKPSFGYVIKKLPKNNCRNEIKLIPENQLSYE
jgi:hypothetical protein